MKNISIERSQGARHAAPLLVILACLTLAVRPGAAAEAFVVIVNAANPMSSLTVQDLSNFFMKKTLRWPQGGEVLPIDLKEQSAVRESFSQRVHAKSTAAVRAYWQKMIFSGRDVPPPEKDASAEVVAYVRANRGAIGYVAADAALGAGVKAIKIAP